VAPASSRRRLPFGASDAPLALVAITIAFNLWALHDQVRDVQQLNDNSIHASMVRWAEYRIRSGHLPFDGWYPYLSQGASRFHHYQSLPHILTGALSVVLGDGVFRWILYLGIACWPLAVYWGARLFDLDPWEAGIAALVSPLVASRLAIGENAVPGIGYEWSSYTWGGSGTWTQLWGMWALPIALALSWRAVAKRRSLLLGGLAVGLTIALHLLTGYLALLMLGVWVLIRPSELRTRLARAAIVGVGALAVSSFMLVPLVTDRAWVVQDEFSRGTYYYDSFGARRILGWLFSGRLFDATRGPVVTLLVFLGLGIALTRSGRDERARAILCVGLLSLLLFFGRPTLGPVLKLLPGGSDLFLRRYLFGVDLAGIFLAGIAGAWLVERMRRLVNALQPEPGPVLAAVITGVVLVMLPFAIRGRIHYASRDGGWIADQAVYDSTDGARVAALVARANQARDGRVFAGKRPTKAPAVGRVPGFASILNLDADGVGFTRPTWSLMSPSEYRFRPTAPALYDLFAARYIITRSPARPSIPTTLVAKDGLYSLSRVDDVGYLEVVDTIAPIGANRTNIGQQMSSFLSSGLIDKKMFPTVAFAGRPAAAPTLRKNQLPPTAPGTVVSSTASPADGLFSGHVEATRPAVVLIKVSFDPRWTATVDGASVKPEMLAPGYVGVAVPVGAHDVVLSYNSYPLYWLWFLVAGLGMVGLAVLDRRARYHGSHVAHGSDDEVESDPAMAATARS
jgi:hypothetical protein